MGETSKSPRVIKMRGDSSFTMNFSSALEHLMNGKKVRQLKWEDEEIYIVMHDDLLMIYKTDDNKVHPLILSAEDITANDWVVVGENRQVH